MHTLSDQAVLLQRLLQRTRVRALRPRSLYGRKKGLKTSFFSVLRKVVGKQAFQFVVKLRAVVGMVQMRELVQENIVLQRFGNAHQVQVQIDVSFRGAGAPVGGIVLDDDAVVFEAIAGSEGGEPGRELGLCLLAQGLDVLPFRQGGILRGNPPEHSPDPFPTGFQEGNAHRIRHPERHGHDDYLSVPDPDGNAPHPAAPAQEHLPQFRVDMDLFAHGGQRYQKDLFSRILSVNLQAFLREGPAKLTN